MLQSVYYLLTVYMGNSSSGKFIKHCNAPLQKHRRRRRLNIFLFKD